MLVCYVGCTRHQYLCWMGKAATCIAASALAVVVGVLPVEYCLGIVRTFAHAEVQEPLRWMHLLLNVVLFKSSMVSLYNFWLLKLPQLWCGLSWCLAEAAIGTAINLLEALLEQAEGLARSVAAAVVDVSVTKCLRSFQ
jgi:hypothetical protein